MPKCLEGTRVFLFPEGLGKKRRELFATQVERLGGCVAPHPRGATHLLLEGDAQPSEVPAGVRVVSTLWLSECIKQNRRVPEEEFIVRKWSCSAETITDEGAPPVKVSRTEKKDEVVETTVTTDAHHSDVKCNQLLLQELQKLADAYKNSGNYK